MSTWASTCRQSVFKACRFTSLSPYVYLTLGPRGTNRVVASTQSFKYQYKYQYLSLKYQYQTYQYPCLKYKYKYQYFSSKYQYQYKYLKMVLKYRSSTSTSTQYYNPGNQCRVISHKSQQKPISLTTTKKTASRLLVFIEPLSLRDVANKNQQQLLQKFTM